MIAYGSLQSNAGLRCSKGARERGGLQRLSKWWSKTRAAEPQLSIGTNL